MIRAATAQDAAQVLAIYALIVENTFISFETEPPDVAGMAERIARVLAAHPWLVFEDEGGVAGYAHAGVHRGRPTYRWSVEAPASPCTRRWDSTDL